MNTVKVVDNLQLNTYEQQNMRLLCTRVNKEIHCQDKQLVIMKEDLSSFEAKLRDEWNRFPLKKKELQERRVDVLIDPLLFLNDRNHIFS